MRAKSGPDMRGSHFLRLPASIWALELDTLCPSTLVISPMSWIYLLIAGVFEIAWPVGLKLAQNDVHRIGGLALAIIGMALSGYFLSLAQKGIPIGTSYAVWTGIGAAGTFVVGIAAFGDQLNLMRTLGVLLIIGGVITLKAAH